MTNLAEKLKQHREDILAIAAHYGVQNVRIFGSVARGNSHDKSDIDFLVSLDAQHTLFDLGGFLQEVQDLLGANVDVVTESGLNPQFKDRIIHEAKAL